MKQNLSTVIDAVNEAFFFGRTLDRSKRLGAANLLVAQQGLPGSYVGMFAPVAGEPAKGYATFTGEVINSEGGARHIMGEEACRVLRLLKVRAARPALAKATCSMITRLDNFEQRGYPIGTYCCGICSCSYWRNLAVGGLDRQGERLAAGMRVLNSRRLGNSRWRAFPVWYTLLALTEIEAPGARAEKQYAALLCERYLRRPAVGEYGARRRRVAEMILSQL